MIACVPHEMKATSSDRFAIGIPARKQRMYRQWRDDELDSTSSTSSQSELGSSPKVPPPSTDFSDALYKLRFGAASGSSNDADDDAAAVTAYSSDDEIVISGILTNGAVRVPTASSCVSAPSSSLNTPKQRRTVRFDEATITSTAEFGETAARFRSLSRRKRSPVAQQQPAARFGGSRNICVTHEDLIGRGAKAKSPVPVQKQRAAPKSDGLRSIFDACDVLTYTGKLT